MKNVNIGKIVVTKDSEGFYNWEHIYNDKVFPINLSYDEFVESLQSLNFDDAFFLAILQTFVLKYLELLKLKTVQLKKLVM